MYPAGTHRRARDHHHVAGVGITKREGAGGDRCPPGTDVGQVHLEVPSLATVRAWYVDGLDAWQSVPRRSFSPTATSTTTSGTTPGPTGRSQPAAAAWRGSNYSSTSRPRRFEGGSSR
jgi:hypothetical protein